MTIRGSSTNFSYGSYDENAAYYDDTYGKLNDYEGEATFIRGLVETMSPPIGAYLEFGCGTGILMSKLDSFPDMIGVDISEGLLSVARSKSIPRTTFFLGDFANFQSWNGKYSLINIPTFIFQTVESIREMSRFLVQASLFLNAGGAIMFSWIDEGEYAKKYSDGPFRSNFDPQWTFEGSSYRRGCHRTMRFSFVDHRGRGIGSEAEYLTVTPEDLKSISNDTKLSLEILDGIGNGLNEPYHKYAVYRKPA